MTDLAFLLRHLQNEPLGCGATSAGNHSLVDECADGYVHAVVVECACDGGLAQALVIVPLQLGIIAARLLVLKVQGALKLTPVALQITAHAGHVHRQFAAAE